MDEEWGYAQGLLEQALEALEEYKDNWQPSPEQISQLKVAVGRLQEVIHN